MERKVDEIEIPKLQLFQKKKEREGLKIHSRPIFTRGISSPRDPPPPPPHPRESLTELYLPL